MPKLKPPLIASIGALLLVGALFLSLFLSTAAYRTEDDVVLPSETTKAPESDAVLGQNLEILGDVQVTASNVQRVIASLSAGGFVDEVLATQESLAALLHDGVHEIQAA